MRRILSINGSYRDDGITDQTVDAVVGALEASSAAVERVVLRDQHIEFCLNCRECTQHAGPEPGECVHHDGMRALIQRIERADGYILAAPTNLGSITAVFKRFMERLVVYAYWPWGAPAPVFRKAKAPQKKAILITSCAAPGVMGRLFYSTPKQLKMTAKIIGAQSVGTIVTGLVAGTPEAILPPTTRRKAETLAKKLLAA